MSVKLYDGSWRRFVVPFFAAAVLLAACPTAAQPGSGAAATLSRLLDLRPGEWRELPDTRMSSVFPRREETTWGAVGPVSVVLAWGGAAYDTKRNAFVFNGGGHADYGGNEVYAFFLEELRWRRLTEPSPMRQLESGQYVTTDGTPVSAHTYDGLEYLPNVDRVFRNGGSEWRDGKNYDRSAWLFDMSRRRWERKSIGGGGLPASAYDPVRGTVYVIGNSDVDEYDPTRDTWVRRVPRQGYFLAGIGAIDPLNRKLITNSYRPGVLVYEIAPDGSLSGRTFPKSEGAIEWDKKMLALEYDPVRKVLVAWAGERDTAYLDGKTLLWRRFANAESAAAPARGRVHSQGIYGRWRYVPKYDVFIGYDNPRGNVWVWKPAAVSTGDSTPPPPEAVPVVKPLLERLQPGQTVTLKPGVYTEAAVVSASNVVIKAHGVRLENAAIEGKAALVIKGDNVTIEGLECSGIGVAGGNGACVRLEAKDLTLRNVWFRDSQSGLLSWNRDSGTVLIEDSRFERLGSGGQAHGVYIGRGTTHLIIRNSRFLSGTGEGHEIKSRAAKNTIERNVIASLDGVDSRLIDLPEGGENVIRRNVLAKGPASSNQDLIGIGLEGQRSLHSLNSTLIEENIIILERSGSNVLLHERHVPAARIERNKVIGGKPLGGNNTWFPDRAAAGLANYPILPQAH
jgi:hypothetical protein